MVRDVNMILESIDSKLGVLISLFLREKDISLKGAVLLMSDGGMDNRSIAKLLGITPVHVAKEKSLASRKRD